MSANRLLPPVADLRHVLKLYVAMLGDQRGQRAKGHTRHDTVRRQPPEFVKSPVDDHDIRAAIDHKHPLQHVLRRRVEALLLGVQNRGGTLALLSDREIGLGPGACGFRHPHPGLAAEVAQQQDQAAGDPQLQPDGRGDDDADAPLPRAHHRCHRVADADDQREVCHRARDDQPILAIEAADLPHHAAVQGAEQAVEIRGVGECLADQGIGVRIAREERSIATVQGERAAAGQRQAGIELLEIGDLDRADHEAEEVPVRGLEPAAEIDLPLARHQAAGWCADERLRRVGVHHPAKQVVVGGSDRRQRPGAGKVQ